MNHTTTFSLLSIAINIFISMRPKQWIKNLFVLAPLGFSKSLLVFPINIKALIAFIIFCLLSGAVYIINDIADKDEDKKHSKKSLRPIASGRLSPSIALGIVAILLCFCFTGGYLVGIDFLAILVLYFLINLAYSKFLKHVILLDVFVISFGFILRVISGSVVINVELSSWILLCTLLIALFLALCKRRHEILLLEDNAHDHRKILGEYNTYFLDQLISVVTASTVISYAFYTMSNDVKILFGNNNLKYTVPFVLYGIFRYLFLVHRKDLGGDPTQIMIRDMPMLVNMGLWAIIVVKVIYF